MGKRWYVLYTEPRQELKAASRVTDRLGFRTFLPLEREYRKDGNWEVPSEIGPLFPRYLFVLFDRNRDEWCQIIHDVQIPVLEVLRDPTRQPSPVPYRVMRQIRWRDRERSRRKPKSRFSRGQPVTIQKGPFQAFTGLVDGTSKDRVKVLLSLFGRATSVECFEKDLHLAAAS